MTIYKDDVGTDIILDTYVDISAGVTTYTIKVRKPDGTEVDWTAAAASEGATKMKYTTQAGDVDQSGEYLLQAYVDFTAGWTGRGRTASLRVADHFR